MPDAHHWAMDANAVSNHIAQPYWCLHDVYTTLSHIYYDANYWAKLMHDAQHWAIKTKLIEPYWCMMHSLIDAWWTALSYYYDANYWAKLSCFDAWCTACIEPYWYMMHSYSWWRLETSAVTRSSLTTRLECLESLRWCLGSETLQRSNSPSLHYTLPPTGTHLRSSSLLHIQC